MNETGTFDRTFESWRNEARRLIFANASPETISWRSADEPNLDLFPASAQDLSQFARANNPSLPGNATFRVPPEFLERAKIVYAFRRDDNPAFLYRLLWRLLKEEPNLLKISIDSDIQEFESRHRLVKKDIHKMHAFVRFRELDDRFIAWHRPDHFILRMAAPFFVERFNGMNWSILTEHECAHWDQKNLTFSEGVPRSHLPTEDASEDLWKAYYRSIFNPARIKWNAMTKELPVRHWKTLPETAAISDLLRTSPERLQKFYREQNPSAEKWLPKPTGAKLTLEDLKQALPSCAACGICERATGPVMGAGPIDAEIAFIGEQPGEEEDLAGTPFIGPAGQLLNQALSEIGIARESQYVTNAVKAYKWTEKENYGRIHRGSSPQEIAACNPWLKKELEIVKPKKIVCLGRSAAQAILGKSVMMRDVRGQVFQTAYSAHTLVVPHPAFILRIADPVQKQNEYARFVEELRRISG
jgi:probable DNA metabolism protein